MWEPQPLTTQGPSRPVTGIALLFLPFTNSYVVPWINEKPSWQFHKFAVKQSGNIIHPNFQMLDYSCQSFESEHAYVVAMICREGHCSREMATPLQKAKCVLWFNITKWVKPVQRRYRTEFGVESPSAPYIMNVTVLWTRVCVLLQNVWMEL
jgi:hypothetical protein